MRYGRLIPNVALVAVLCGACNKAPGDSTPAPSTAPALAASAQIPVSAPSPSAEPLSDEAAEKVALETSIAFLKAAVADKQRFPMKDVKSFTAEDDPNKLLGRPGQYVTKMAWKLSGEDATIEVFRNPEDAKKRADYVETIGKNAPMFLEYVYVNAKRSAVLRLPKDVTPTAEASASGGSERISSSDSSTWSSGDLLLAACTVMARSSASL